jgi:sulfur-oxidizing protein SoxY
MTIEATRRRVLVASAGAAGCLILPWGASAPARATPADVAAKIRDVVGDAPLKRGRIKLDLPILVESANAVSVTLLVEDRLPPEARVLSFHLFAEQNPLPNVAHFHFGPRSGRPRVSTRIRLATSQTVIAVAKCADGSCWSDSVETLVALAACLD